MSYNRGGTNTEELLDNLFKDFLEDYPQFASEMEQIKQSIPPILDEQTRLAIENKLYELAHMSVKDMQEEIVRTSNRVYHRRRRAALEKPNRERST